MESVKIVTPASVKHRNFLQSLDGMLYLASFVALMYLLGQGSRTVPFFYLWGLLCLAVCAVTFFRLFKLRGRYGKPVVLGHLDVDASELVYEKRDVAERFSPEEVGEIRLVYTGYADWRGRSWKGDMNYLTIVTRSGESLECEIQLMNRDQKDRFKKELKAFCNSGQVVLKVSNRTSLKRQF